MAQLEIVESPLQVVDNFLAKYLTGQFIENTLPHIFVTTDKHTVYPYGMKSKTEVRIKWCFFKDDSLDHYWKLSYLSIIS